MPDLSRRGIFGLFAGGAVVAAIPAPVLAALPEALPVAPPVMAAATSVLSGGKNRLLTINMITREAVRLFQEQNAFVAGLSAYEGVADA